MQRHYFGLDLLRFFAALLVVFFHFGRFSQTEPVYPSPPDSLAWPEMHYFTDFGWVGVQIFFVISGFVIAASAIGTTAKHFIFRRVIRVIPALWVYCLIDLCIRLGWGEAPSQVLGDFLRSIFLSPVGPYIDGVIWTLVVEAVFYALIAVLILMQPRDLTRHRMLMIGAYVLGICSSLFIVVSSAAVAWDTTALGSRLAPLLERYFFSVLLLRHGVFFAIGMLVWAGENRGYTKVSLYCLALFFVMGVLQIFNLREPDPMVALLPCLVWIAALSAAWLSIRAWTNPVGPRVATVLRSIGLLTYPIYLGHFVVGLYLIPALSQLIENKVMLLTVMLGIVFGLAYAVMQGPERAVQGWMKKRLRPNQSHLPAGATR